MICHPTIRRALLNEPKPRVVKRLIFSDGPQRKQFSFVLLQDKPTFAAISQETLCN